MSRGWEAGRLTYTEAAQVHLQKNHHTMRNPGLVKMETGLESTGSRSVVPLSLLGSCEDLWK